MNTDASGQSALRVYVFLEFSVTNDEGKQCLNRTFTLLSLERVSFSGTCEKGYYVLQGAANGVYCFLVGDTLRREGANRCVGPSVVEIVPREASGRGGSSGSLNAKSTYARSLSEELSLVSWRSFHELQGSRVASSFFHIRCRQKMSYLIIGFDLRKLR